MADDKSTYTMTRAILARPGMYFDSKRDLLSALDAFALGYTHGRRSLADPSAKLPAEFLPDSFVDFIYTRLPAGADGATHWPARLRHATRTEDEALRLLLQLFDDFIRHESNA